MNDTLKLVLETTKQALSLQTISLNEIDEKTFLSMLKNSGLSGVVLPYIDLNNRSPRFNQLAKSMIYEYITRDEKQKDLIQRTNRILNDHKIDHIYLKGARLKKMYPNSYMRGMGDIDILVKEEDMERVNSVFKSNAILLNTPSLAHDLYRDINGFIIEVHPRIHNDFNGKYGDFFKTPWDHSFLIDVHEFQLKPTFELIYLLYHLAKHLESSGIGLRSILDIGIFIQHHEKSIEQHDLLQQLTNAKMLKFYSTIIFMTEHLFGIKTHMKTNNFFMSDVLIDQFTDYLVSSGIHGQGENFNTMVPRISNSKNRERSRFGILLRIAFPKYKHLAVMYPSLKRCFLLYPYFCLVRWSKLIFKNNRASRRKLKLMRSASGDKQAAMELFNQIGLN